MKNKVKRNDAQCLLLWLLIVVLVPLCLQLGSHARDIAAWLGR